MEADDEDDRLDLLSDLASLSDTTSKPVSASSPSVKPSTQSNASNIKSSNAQDVATSPSNDSDGLPDLDALTRRFEALRKRT